MSLEALCPTLQLQKLHRVRLVICWVCTLDHLQQLVHLLLESTVGITCESFLYTLLMWIFTHLKLWRMRSNGKWC